MLVFVGLAWAQDTSTMFTDGTGNGRFWRAISKDAKVAYIIGFGVTAYHENLLPSSLPTDKAWIDTVQKYTYPLSLTNGEVRDAIDRF